MKHIFHAFALIVLSLFMLACSGERRQAADALARAAAIVEQQPDSALLLLKTITHPQRLQKPLSMEYTLLNVQAKDKSILDISSDTTIFVVANYYMQAQDVEKAALALFYCGRVYQEQGSYKQATQAYLKANDYAQDAEDYQLQGLVNSNLGRLSYERRLFDRAATYYKRALGYFLVNTEKHSRIAWTFVDLGSCFLQQEQADSAQLYYNKGLGMAEFYHDTALLFTIYQCVGVALQQKGQLEQAKHYLCQVEPQKLSPQHRGALYCNLGYLYFDLYKMDSARYYAEKILKLYEQDSTANAELVNAYELLAKVAERRGKPTLALQHYRKHIEYLHKLLDKTTDFSILEVGKKYRNEKLKNDNIRLLLAKQRFMVAALLLVMLVLAAAAAFYLYREYSKKRIENAEKNIYVLRQVTSSLNTEGENMLGEKERLLRRVIAQQFDLLKSVPPLEQALTEKLGGKEAVALLNRLVYKRVAGSWQVLYQATNELCGGVMDKLREQHPQLDELELRLCCLTLAKLDNTEISAVMGLKVKTTQNRKSSIRKKMGIPDSDDIGQTLRAMIA